MTINLLLNIMYSYDVQVSFEENAWCDEQVTRLWIIEQCKPVCSGHTLLALDTHKAQTTEAI